MPDQSEMAGAVAAAVVGMLYPQGAAAASAVGATCRVFRGAAVAPAVEADASAGIVQVAVGPVDGTWRDTSRFEDFWQVLQVAAPGITVAVDGDTVTFGGVPRLGDAAGLRADGRTYATRVRQGDEPALVAAVLAGLVRADRPALVTGPAVQLPGASDVLGRVAADGGGGRELRRQVQTFRAAVHAPDFSTRDRVAALVEQGFALQQFMDVRGWACRVLPGGGATTDDGAAGIWRRDVLLLIEWPTTVEADLPSMLFGVSGLNAGTMTA